jgi:hypothetical protein
LIRRLRSASGLVLLRADELRSACYTRSSQRRIALEAESVDHRAGWTGPLREHCHRHHQRRRLDDDQYYTDAIRDGDERNLDLLLRRDCLMPFTAFSYARPA